MLKECGMSVWKLSDADNLSRALCKKVYYHHCKEMQYSLAGDTTDITHSSATISAPVEWHTTYTARTAPLLSNEMKLMFFNNWCCVIFFRTTIIFSVARCFLAHTFFSLSFFRYPPFLSDARKIACQRQFFINKYWQRKNLPPRGELIDCLKLEVESSQSYLTIVAKNSEPNGMESEQKTTKDWLERVEALVKLSLICNVKVSCHIW